MYTLTLTKEERKAIDWIGNRYNHGDDFYNLLMKCVFEGYWDFNEDITFLIPEHIAWMINKSFEDEEYTFSCFSKDFASKLINFCMTIV